MRIHTHNPKLTEKYLKELDLPFSIMNKKSNKNDVFDWVNLPSFNWDETLLKTTYYDLKLPKDKREAFFKKFNQKVTQRSYIHFERKSKKYENYEYEIKHTVNPKYPVYVLSKGRYEKRYTVDSLEEMKCPYKIVIEPDEYENYAKHIDKKNILVLPKKYANKKQGGIPARNFIWKHSKKLGFKKHWILDDNIDGFYRWNYNVKRKVKSGVVFKVLEDYSDRYENNGLVGMSYYHTIPAIHIERTMMIINSRCYSCILVNMELLDKTLDERWRGIYNEDTDLSIRVLKAGLTTFLFNNFLCNKKTSGTMKGGNTDSIYDGGSHEGYMKKFESLQQQHPDIVKFTNKKHKDGRPHHHISYTKHFKTKPKLICEIYSKEMNEYNMTFKSR